MEQSTTDILTDLGQRLDRIGVRLDLPTLEHRIQELEAETTDPDFWSDNERARRTMRQLTGMRNRVDSWHQMRSSVEQLTELDELIEDDPDLIHEVRSESEDLARQVDSLELELLLDGPYDENDAIVAIHAGTGGVDAQDWAEMLVRMYTRWGERRGFEVSLLDRSEGDEAGIKSAALEFKGDFAYGYTKSEAGNHRLVRLSPFDAANRRHTAFALVEVLPEVEDDLEIDLRDEDIRVDTYRSSGAGGQHVNKTSSAVRLTHIPTGIVVTCQDERSQLQNRATAMKILRARLTEMKLREREAEQAELKGDVNVEGWGSRIRSYVLQPYTMVTDHRTDYSTGNVAAVLDGDLDPLIDAYLHHTMTDGHRPADD
ncbi:MAG: peptide chain release factor 2 [Thermomicrobiales bacterium]